MGFRVVALSSDADKEGLARSLGADEFVDVSKVDATAAMQALGGVKVIMSTAPNAAATERLLDALCVDGTLLVLAVEPEPMRIAPCESLPQRWVVLHSTDCCVRRSGIVAEAPEHQGLAVRLAEGRGGLSCVRAGEGHQVHGRAVPAAQGTGGLRQQGDCAVPGGHCSVSLTSSSESSLT